MLEYFWNRRRKVRQAYIPLSVIYFLETQDLNPVIRDKAQLRADTLIADLIAKGYLKKERLTSGASSFIYKDQDVLRLDDHGIDFINEMHPKPLIWWTRILDETPGAVSLFIAVIGLAASIFGLVDSETLRKLFANLIPH